MEKDTIILNNRSNEIIEDENVVDKLFDIAKQNDLNIDVIHLHPTYLSMPFVQRISRCSLVRITSSSLMCSLALLFSGWYR